MVERGSGENMEELPASPAYDMRNEDLGSSRKRLNGQRLSRNDMERKN